MDVKVICTNKLKSLKFFLPKLKYLNEIIKLLGYAKGKWGISETVELGSVKILLTYNLCIVNYPLQGSSVFLSTVHRAVEL